MREKLLYRIKNISTRRATYKAVIKAEPLKLEVCCPAIPVLAAHMIVEDMTIAGHENMKTTEKFQEELPGILNGDIPRWHLWRAMIYRERLLLEFADRESREKRPRVTALRCWMRWPDGLDMAVLTNDKKCPRYDIFYLGKSRKSRVCKLTVRYFDHDNSGYYCLDTYSSVPRS